MMMIGDDDEQGYYHVILAPGLSHEDIDGNGHADELYLEFEACLPSLSSSLSSSLYRGGWHKNLVYIRNTLGPLL